MWNGLKNVTFGLPIIRVQIPKHQSQIFWEIGQKRIPPLEKNGYFGSGQIWAPQDLMAAVETL